MSLRELLSLNVETVALEPPAEIKHKILFYAHRYAKPFYLGFLANDIEWSISHTEKYVKYLVEAGLLRKLSLSEVQSFSFIETAQIYVIVGDIDAQASHHR